MSNALSPDRMTAAERLDEVAEILAAGLRRWHDKTNTNEINVIGEFRLDFPPTGSMHEPETNRRKRRRQP